MNGKANFVYVRSGCRSPAVRTSSTCCMNLRYQSSPVFKTTTQSFFPLRVASCSVSPLGTISMRSPIAPRVTLLFSSAPDIWEFACHAIRPYAILETALWLPVCLMPRAMIQMLDLARAAPQTTLRDHRACLRMEGRSIAEANGVIEQGQLHATSEPLAFTGQVNACCVLLLLLRFDPLVWVLSMLISSSRETRLLDRRAIGRSASIP